MINWLINSFALSLHFELSRKSHKILSFNSLVFNLRFLLYPSIVASFSDHRPRLNIHSSPIRSSTGSVINDVAGDPFSSTLDETEGHSL